METDRQRIEDQAAAFLQRRDTGPWTAASDAELSAWLNASTAHRVAYLRTEAAWEAMGRLKALGAGLPQRCVPTAEVINATFSRNIARADFDAEQVPRRPQWSRWPLAAAIAAGLTLTAGLAFLGYGRWPGGDRYTTPVGGLTSVPLQDGSHITLNSSTDLHVVLNDSERHVDLNQGEAFFEVAKDARRPFVVQAKHTRVIAVGTQFSVRREGDDIVQVVVTEGRVRIENHGATQEGGLPLRTFATSLPPGEGGALVTAGEIAHISAKGLRVQDEPLSEAEDTLSWRSGYLVFRNTSLEDALAEFNRYNTKQIVLNDPALAVMPLTGRFRATNSEAFVNLLEQTFRVKVDHSGGTIVLNRAGS